jgi:hypothetical protein
MRQFVVHSLLEATEIGRPKVTDLQSAYLG